jgi:hypothetical protein
MLAARTLHHLQLQVGDRDDKKRHRAKTPRTKKLNRISPNLAHLAKPAAFAYHCFGSMSTSISSLPRTDSDRQRENPIG